MKVLRPSVAASSLLASLVLPASADTIFRTDGSSVPDVEVRVETLAAVEYRESGKKQTIPSDQVLRVTYSAMPQLVDQAEASAAEGMILDAIADLETYVDGFLAAGDKRERFEWAPAHAAWRLVQLQSTVGAFDKAVAAAQKLIDSFPDTRQVPLAYLAKAEAQFDKGEGAKALGTLGELEALVQTKGLARRWQLEAELAKVLCDSSLTGQARLDRLIEVSAKAGKELPTVRSRADIAQAEALLEAKKLEDAEKMFQRVVDDPKAEPRTLAAAYTGLGDCLFQRSVKAGDTAEGQQLRKDALLAFMRVVVVFEGESRYVPKAMFYAGRALEMQQTPEILADAQKLYSAVIREYDGTPWANEARGFRKR